jgi:hypothetical protein
VERHAQGAQPLEEQEEEREDTQQEVVVEGAEAREADNGEAVEAVTGGDAQAGAIAVKGTGAAKRYVKGERPKEAAQQEVQQQQQQQEEEEEERFTNPLHRGEIDSVGQSGTDPTDTSQQRESSSAAANANPLFAEKGRAFTVEREQDGKDYRAMSMSPEEQLKMALEMSEKEGAGQQ